MNFEKARKRLQNERHQLLAQSKNTEDSRRPVELDQQAVGRLSRMDSLQQQAMAVEQERRRALQLSRIDAALARIEAGRYGECVTCSEEIGDKRLELDPSVPICVDCARK